MRLVISYENHLSNLGYFFEPGSLKWDKEKGVPVVWNALTRLEDILGKAEDLYRCVDGAITCEFTPNDNWTDLKVDTLKPEIHATIFCNQVIHRQVGQIHVVRSALIREVFFAPGGEWNSFIEED